MDKIKTYTELFLMRRLPLIDILTELCQKDKTIESQAQELSTANEKVKYMKDMGLEFGIMKTSKAPEGFLQHTYREGSSMHKGQQELLHAMTSNIDNEALKQELSTARDKIKELREHIISRGHRSGCNWKGDGTCSCGYYELLKESE